MILVIKEISHLLENKLMMKFSTVRNIIKILNMKIKMGMKKKSSIIFINIVIKKFLEIYYIPKTEKRIRSRR